MIKHKYDLVINGVDYNIKLDAALLNVKVNVEVMHLKYMMSSLGVIPINTIKARRCGSGAFIGACDSEFNKPKRFES